LVQIQLPQPILLKITTAWPEVFQYHRPFARLHQRHINTGTEKRDSHAFTGSRRHSATITSAALSSFPIRVGDRNAASEFRVCGQCHLNVLVDNIRVAFKFDKRDLEQVKLQRSIHAFRAVETNKTGVDGSI
jgi:hypothetical protein